ncbi:hypothetical protein Trydic_g13757 [Trypoxylus dichotomus]
MPSCVEYNIGHIFAAASYSGTAPISNVSAAYIRLNLSGGLDYADIKRIDRLRLIDVDPHFRKSHSGVKCHDLGGQFTLPLREIIIPSNRSRTMSIVASAVWRVALSCWNHMSSTSTSLNLNQIKIGTKQYLFVDVLLPGEAHVGWCCPIYLYLLT